MKYQFFIHKFLHSVDLVIPCDDQHRFSSISHTCSGFSAPSVLIRIQLWFQGVKRMFWFWSVVVFDSYIGKHLALNCRTGTNHGVPRNAFAVDAKQMDSKDILWKRLLLKRLLEVLYTTWVQLFSAFGIWNDRLQEPSYPLFDNEYRFCNSDLTMRFQYSIPTIVCIPLTKKHINIFSAQHCWRYQECSLLHAITLQMFVGERELASNPHFCGGDPTAESWRCRKRSRSDWWKQHGSALLERSHVNESAHRNYIENGDIVLCLPISIDALPNHSVSWCTVRLKPLIYTFHQWSALLTVHSWFINPPTIWFCLILTQHEVLRTDLRLSRYRCRLADTHSAELAQYVVLLQVLVPIPEEARGLSMCAPEAASHAVAGAHPRTSRSRGEVDSWARTGGGLLTMPIDWWRRNCWRPAVRLLPVPRELWLSRQRPW